MKTSFIIFLVIFTHFAPTYSQSRIDVQLGVNIARLSDPGNLIEGAVWNTRSGFIGSIGTDLSLSDELSLSPGFRFIQKGTTSQFSFPGEGVIRGELRLNYVEIPIYVKLKALDLGTQLFVLGGPTLSYLLSSTMEASSDAHGTLTDVLKSKYKNFDASVDLGVSTLTPLSTGLSIVATALYSYGVVKISDSVYDDTGWGAPANSNEQTRDIRVLVGIAYSFN